MSYSTIATIDNLNTVYSDIRHRIDALGDVYSVKGSLKYANLATALEKAEPGDVYNVTDVPEEVKDYIDGDNVVCVVSEDNTKSWAKLGGIYELATDATAGLVFLGANGEDTPNEVAKTYTAGDSIKRGLKMGATSATDKDPAGDHGAYITIPLAAEDTYGLVSTGVQTFSGNKTIVGSLKVTDNVEVGDTLTVGEGTTVGDAEINGMLTVTNGNVTASNASLAELTVTKNTTTTDLEVNNAEDGTPGTLTITGNAIVSSTYKTDTLETNTTDVESVSDKESTKGIVANKISAAELIVKNTFNVNTLDAEELKVTGNDVVEVNKITPFEEKQLDITVGSDIKITKTLTAGTVDVTEIKGNTTGCTLNVNTINVQKEGDTSGTTISYVAQGETVTKGNNKEAIVGSEQEGLKLDKSLYVLEHLYAGKVHNAVWNDLADAIEIDVKPEYGYVYCFDGEHYNKSSKYCQKGIIGIHSDTAGMIMGEKGKENELNCAVAGFVLAHTDKVYSSGTPLTTGKNGVLTKMKKKDLILHPDRLVANFWKEETAEKWNGVEVNNRHWVKVR